MHAAAANDPPLLARNLLGGPLRTTSAAVTGRGRGNTCMPGAIVELDRGPPDLTWAHETPFSLPTFTFKLLSTRIS